jgi:branched-chain amino acid aminotransferase
VHNPPERRFAGKNAYDPCEEPGPVWSARKGPALTFSEGGAVTSRSSSASPVTPSKASTLWPTPAEIGDKPLVWVNGHLLPKHKAMVSVYDHGLLYGDGVFEGIRVYQGRIFKCKQHMDRLYRCAEAIHIKIPITPEEMVTIQRQCIEANNITEGYIRLLVTRGYGTLGLDPRKCPVPGIICIADQIRLYAPEFYETGMRVVVAKRPKTPVACLDPRVKSLNYLNNILAKVEAIEAGCDEAIMLSTDGYVTECTGDNIFIVKDGKIYTPPITSGNSGALEGVTRNFVIRELAPMCGLSVTEKLMRLDDVLAADEVFLTGTAAEIIDETRISDGEGPVTAKLRKKFREIVTSGHVPED